MSLEPATVPRRGAGGAGHWRAALWSVLAASMLAGCTTTATYLGTTQQQFYFKVPAHWVSYSPTALQSLGLPTTANNAQLQAQGSSYPLYTSFAAPVAHLGPAGLAGQHPWALGLVVSLGSQDQVGMSLSSLQDEVFNVDGAASAGVPVAPLAPEKVVVKGSLRGTIVSYAILGGPKPIAFEQEALMNSPTNKVWLLAAGCSPSCFVANRSLINRIIKSFTVTAGGT